MQAPNDLPSLAPAPAVLDGIHDATNELEASWEDAIDFITRESTDKTRTGTNSSIISSQSSVFIGDSPLHRACEKKCLFQVRQLVEELKDLNPKNRLGQTPLHVSVNNDALEISKVYRCRFAGFTWENTFDDLLPKKECINSTGLIKAKAKHDLKDSFGNMPIHISSSCGAAACLDVLISAGSCINAVNFQNETPLYLAAKRDNLLIIKKNLKCKPLVDVTSLSGLSAKGVAQISGHKKAVELIQAYEREDLPAKKKKKTA